MREHGPAGAARRACGGRLRRPGATTRRRPGSRRRYSGERRSLGIWAQVRGPDSDSLRVSEIVETRAVSVDHRGLLGHRTRDREDAPRRGVRAHARVAHRREDRSGRGRARAPPRPPPTSRSPRTASGSCASTWSEPGGLDLLVNSAGIGIAGRVEDAQLKHIDRQLAINLRGLVLVSQAAIPHLRETKGWIVNLASIAGTQPVPILPIYAATKAAVISLTHSLNADLDDDGVRAIAHLPRLRGHADGGVRGPRRATR